VRIYTRAGDDGTTGVLGAGRLSKADPRIEAYGSVDELNATIGLSRAADEQGWLASELESIQRALFQAGAELATTEPAALAKLTRIDDAQVLAIEQLIDRLEAELPALTSFVIPGGSRLAAHLHVARTVCRRAERRVVALAGHAAVEPRLVRYLNRVGDLLFVMARWCNRKSGAGDLVWRQPDR
jgi:cob(I)alamin adenosyltransferase